MYEPDWILDFQKKLFWTFGAVNMDFISDEIAEWMLISLG